MKKKIGIIISFLLILSYIYNNFFTQQMLIGTYQNRNFINSPVGPRIPDKLVLHENSKFSSNYWGNGIYKISHSLMGTNIYLDCDNSFHTTIKRTWYGKTKIIVFSDLETYYEKIN